MYQEDWWFFRILGRNGLIRGALMRVVVIIMVLGILIVGSGGILGADRLPPQVPENQRYSIDTQLDANGTIGDLTKVDWMLASVNPIPTGMLTESQVIAMVSYRDESSSNGGHMNEMKSMDFDSKSKSKNLFNMESEKVLTYQSIEGSHLIGVESLLLDDAGNYTNAAGTVRCVFADPLISLIPAFCNVVSSRSELINMNHAQISSKSQIRAASTYLSSPAGMNYRITVTPDGTAGIAEGTVRTSFAGSVMEARDTNVTSISTANPEWNKTAVTHQWHDQTEATGMIRNLQKNFNYVSGMIL